LAVSFPTMETIATFSTPEAAHLLRMRLEALGIPAYVQDQSVDLVVGGVDEVNVEVAEEDVQTALAVLASDKGAEPDAAQPL
jgi:Putative prokaryotic signal transducing protein